MNEHDKKFYNKAVSAIQELKTGDFNINVLEYVARNHSCQHNKRIFNKKQIYDELKKTFNREETNVIIQLLGSYNKQNGETYPKWESHLIALRVAKTVCE